MFRTSLLTSVAFAAVMFAKSAALQVVDPELETPPAGGEDSTQGGGGDSTIQGSEGNDSQAAAGADDDKAPVVTAEVYDMDDIADLSPRTRSEAINFGFREWPVGGHALITADLADRARSAVQNAKLTNAKDNGKQFITRSAVGLKNKAGVVLYPNAKKGDIEVVRIRDAVVAATPAPAPEAEAPKAEEKTLENA